ncbi:MAG: TIR domain-containing protein, partial [Candidatus Aenigmarchaeota archaeon]|nr:TIR domain-containing protein [Candidatus Aenigmarchaeota archaeon]
MKQNKGLNLFISYSHQDEKPYIEEFKKHLAPLRDNGWVEDWYDRKILPGEDYQSKINNNLEDANIICLFISPNFLSSENCKKEKKRALELRRKKRVSVIPIILSPCGWRDDEDISKLLALPTDGKPVSSFQNKDEGWLDIYNGLKRVIQKEIKIKQLRVKEEFEKFLQDTELLIKAHPQKERVLLDDIFVHLELDKYDELKEYEGKISTKELLENIIDYPKIVISGEDQSGKTTLCKIIFNELRERNFVPVYICVKRNRLEGKIEGRIAKAFQEQYEGVNISEISQERIVLIIDDFHHAKKKEKHLNDLDIYPHCIIIVDDVFSLNIKDKKLIEPFSHFRINELKPSLRYKLIKKWVSLRDREIR